MQDLEQFRVETRQWLEANCPLSQRQPLKTQEIIWPGRNQTFYSEDARLWFERMRDRGWICPDFPTEYGGGGLDPATTRVLREEMQRLNCRPALTDQGISMLAPALLEFGSEAQKQQHISAIVQGKIRWCQGYSEPGAGSDLASLQCKAVADGSDFIINGSKIWTSFGVESDWIFCLVRTATTDVKQQGITFILIDMQSAGVTAKPIELISGASEFSQVFFDDVRVPKANVVGAIDNGWVIAKALLKQERKMMSELNQGIIGSGSSVADMVKQYGENRQAEIDDTALRLRVARHEMQMNAINLTGYRIHQQTIANQLDPHLPLIMKYASTSEVQIKDELLADAMGYRALGCNDSEFNEDEQRVCRELLFNKALTIAGGTSEIQLNIIARNALGLTA